VRPFFFAARDTLADRLEQAIFDKPHIQGEYRWNFRKIRAVCLGID
jgi:hypothetical protein